MRWLRFLKLFFFLGLLLIAANSALAAGCTLGRIEVPIFGSAKPCIDDLIGGANPLVTYLGGLANLFLVAIVATAMVIIVIAGYIYMTAGGSGSRVEKAKEMIAAALIGLILALLSYTLLHQVSSALTPKVDPTLFLPTSGAAGAGPIR